VQPSGYRFFGILTAKGVLVLILAILLGMLAAAVFLPQHWSSAAWNQVMTDPVDSPAEVLKAA
jgi:hypothetical protein